MKSIAETIASLGEQVRQLRIAQGVSQAELAARANLGVATVQRLETGRDVSLSTVVAVARVLDRQSWFAEFDPIGSGPTPMQLLRERESKPSRPRRVSRRRS